MKFLAVVTLTTSENFFPLVVIRVIVLPQHIARENTRSTGHACVLKLSTLPTASCDCLHLSAVQFCRSPCPAHWLSLPIPEKTPHRIIEILNTNMLQLSSWATALQVLCSVRCQVLVAMLNWGSVVTRPNPRCARGNWNRNQKIRCRRNCWNPTQWQTWQPLHSIPESCFWVPSPHLWCCHSVRAASLSDHHNL